METGRHPPFQTLSLGRMDIIRIIEITDTGRLAKEPRKEGWTPRIESGGVWTIRRTFGETAGELGEPDDEVRPLPKTVGRATIRYRILPFTFIPRRRRFRPSDYDRHHGPTDSELIAG